MADRIVVGVDGSAGSTRALRWAVDEARRRAATVDVVHAWQYPHVPDVGFAVGGYSIDPAALEASARTVLDHCITSAASGDGVRIEPILVCGDPASTLLDVAKGADLLVVGSRGRGGFVGLLLGSVSQQCAHHTPCPLVIVPEAPDAAVQPKER
jgi:nucleotide-binding universal stress UspA family protein